MQFESGCVQGGRLAAGPEIDAGDAFAIGLMIIPEWI